MSVLAEPDVNVDWLPPAPAPAPAPPPPPPSILSPSGTITQPAPVGWITPSSPAPAPPPPVQPSIPQTPPPTNPAPTSVVAPSAIPAALPTGWTVPKTTTGTRSTLYEDYVPGEDYLRSGKSVLPRPSMLYGQVSAPISDPEIVSRVVGDRWQPVYGSRNSPPPGGEQGSIHFGNEPPEGWYWDANGNYWGRNWVRAPNGAWIPSGSGVNINGMSYQHLGGNEFIVTPVGQPMNMGNVQTGGSGSGSGTGSGAGTGGGNVTNPVPNTPSVGGAFKRITLNPIRPVSPFGAVSAPWSPVSQGLLPSAKTVAARPRYLSSPTPLGRPPQPPRKETRTIRSPGELTIWS